MQGKKLSGSFSWSKEEASASLVYYYVGIGAMLLVGVFFVLPRIAAGS
jgi:hypothetical protein